MGYRLLFTWGDRVLAEADRLAAENARMKEALQPFARYADAVLYGSPDRPLMVHPVSGDILVRVSDFRGARAVLAERPQ